MKHNYSNFYRAAGVCFCLSLFSSAWADTVQVGDLFFDTDNTAKTATVIKDDSYASLTSVTIPGKVTVSNTDYTVTAVGVSAFEKCNSITTLKFDEGVTLIGEKAFYMCKGLTSVLFPTTLTTVDKSAFASCSALTKLVLPANLTTINNSGFSNCTKLVEISLPGSLKKLTDNAFNGASALKTVNFAEGLEVIENNAFYGSGLETVTLPSTVKSLGIGAFSNSTKLKTITLPEGLTSLGDQAFYKCTALEQAKFPSTLESIGNATFYECKALNGITFPTAIKSINDNAFYGCTSLTSIMWPEALTSINNNMFYGCSALADIKLHDGITFIGKSAFRDNAFTTIKLPSKLTEISDGLFYGCENMTSLEIPESVTTIGTNAFRNTGLIELNISANVTSLGSSMITGCIDLQRVNIAENNPNYADIDGVVFNKEKTLLRAYPGGKGGEYVMPESTTDVFQYAFNQVTSITGIKFSKNLKTIGLSAFYGCSKLESLEFYDALEKIDDTAFFMDRGIKSVVMTNNNALDIQFGNNAFSMLGVTKMLFPEGIKSIGVTETSNYSIMGSCSSAKWISFPSTLEELSPLGSGCTLLEAIYCFAVNPPVLKGTNKITTFATIYVPKGSAKAYEEAWSELYPGVKFEEVLPVAPTTEVSKNTAKISWEPYSDDLYTGTPVRYIITLGDDTEGTAIEGEAASAKTVSHTFSNLQDGTYNYTIKGFSSLGELSFLHNGEFEISTSGVEGVASDNEVVSVEYFDVQGYKVANPTANTLYIVRTKYADGSVETTKALYK